MINSGQHQKNEDPVPFQKDGYATLCDAAVHCVLTKTDRRALAEHIQRADKVGTGAFAMLTRLLSQKLLYATVRDDDKISAAAAAGGSRVTYAIDDYCGFDPVMQWMQALPEAGSPISCSGSSQSGKRRGKGRRTKATQSDKHLSLANSKSYD